MTYADRIGYRCLVALLGVALGLTVGNYVWADTTAPALPKPRHVVVEVAPIPVTPGTVEVQS